MVILESERVILRPWRDSDAEALYKYASDEEVGACAGWPPHRSVEESAEVIRTFFSAPDTFAVVLKLTGEPVGCIGLVPSDAVHYPGIKDGEREVGYWIGRSYWGCGLIPEALALLSDYCRKDLGLSRLWIITYADNFRSQRVAIKCNFRFVKDFKDPDGCESKLFGLPLQEDDASGRCR